MPQIPVAEAARMVGVQRSTLYRKKKSGEISFVKNEKGADAIDASELLRLYPNAKISAQDKQQEQVVQMHQMPNDTTAIDNKLLQQKVESLLERLADKEHENTRLWHKLEAEAEERRKLTMLITYREQEKDKEPEKKEGWFARLLKL